MSCQKLVSQKCTHNMWFIKQNVSYQTERSKEHNNHHECALGAVLRDFRSCCRDLSLIEGNWVPDRAVQKIRVRRMTRRCIKNTFPAESNRAEIQNVQTGGRRQEKKDAARSFVGEIRRKGGNLATLEPRMPVSKSFVVPSVGGGEKNSDFAIIDRLGVYFRYLPCLQRRSTLDEVPWQEPSIKCREGEGKIQSQRIKNSQSMSKHNLPGLVWLELT